MIIEVKVPANLEEVIQLIDDSGKNVGWGFYAKPKNFFAEKIYDAYKPIAFLYQDGELKCAAHHKSDTVQAFDILDRPFALSDEQITLIENVIKPI